MRVKRLQKEGVNADELQQFCDFLIRIGQDTEKSWRSNLIFENDEDDNESELELSLRLNDSGSDDEENWQPKLLPKSKLNSSKKNKAQKNGFASI